ncbi:hypothetical protein NDU88_009288 [Pleurodeles waltl]|uniref:Uncharacterized protein n=1 Tax=Pleurodeles waltl TaxID=8319 RepID=A0AAV7QUS0_PLEWA|nr:hypothetical protein NDU88_009288 [Pleurodeles waltl]
MWRKGEPRVSLSVITAPIGRRFRARRLSSLAVSSLPFPTRGVARTAAGVLRSRVCRESGPESSGTSPELRRPALGAAFSLRPHLDVIFTGCGAELF